MRILVVNAFYPPITTGSSHFTADLVAELQRRNHVVHVVTADPEGGADPDPGITRLPARWVRPGEIAYNYAIPVLRRQAARELPALIESFKPDVVSCQGQIFDLTWRAARAARRARVPVTVTVHSAIRHTNRALDLVLGLGELLTVRRALRDPSIHWIAVDKRTFEHARDRYRVAPAHLSFAPVMLETGSFDQGDPERARRRFDLGRGPVLLSLGHVVPVRDRIALVRALPRILAEHPDLQLVIVGELYTDGFLRVADELGVRRSIVTTGRVPHDCIPDLLAAASLEIHDLQGIGLGITTLEAMAAGVPIAAWVPDDNYPGMSLRSWPDLVLLPDVEPATIAEAALRLLRDESLRQAVVSQQRRFVEDLFTPAAVASRYESVFEAVSSPR